MGTIPILWQIERLLERVTYCESLKIFLELSWLQFDQNSNENGIELQVGEEFMVILHENPTTGFHWNPISSGEPACTLHDNSFDLIESTPGNGGIHSWHFQAVKEGSNKIEYVYRSSWEQGSPAEQLITLIIYVRK